MDEGNTATGKEEHGQSWDGKHHLEALWFLQRSCYCSSQFGTESFKVLLEALLGQS